MEASLPHYVEYDLERYPSVSALAQSLLANERLATEAVLLLEAYIPGLSIEATAVSVRGISQESPLREAFVVAIVAAFQPTLGHDVPEIIADLTGHPLPVQYQTLVTVLVLLVAVYGVSKAIDILFPGRKKRELEENYKNLTIVAGDLIQLPASTIDTAIRARFSGKKANQVGALVKGFFAPASGQRHARIIGAPGIEITPEALEEVPDLALPESADEGVETPDTQFENDKNIVIHAMDRDRGKYGWAAHIPDLFADRVPMKLDKSIPPESLFMKNEIRGDVLVVYDVDRSGVRTPAEIHLLRIRDAPRS